MTSLKILYGDPPSFKHAKYPNSRNLNDKNGHPYWVLLSQLELCTLPLIQSFLALRKCDKI